MPYTPQSWVNGSAGATPLSAARLNIMEAGIAGAYDPPASTSVAGLVQLTNDFGGTSTAPTTPSLGHMPGGTMAQLDQWVAPGSSFASSPALLVEGVTGGQLMRVARACTIDKLAVKITVVGTTGSVIRLGIYKITYNSVGAPVASLLSDAGTVVGTAVATVEKTLPAPLVVDASTNLWLTATGQGTPATQPTVTMGEMVGFALPFTTASAALATLGGLQATGNPGALPTTPTVSVVNAATPRIALHTSA